MNAMVLLSVVGMFVTGMCFYFLYKRFSIPRQLFYLINFVIGVAFGYRMAQAYGLPFSNLTLWVMAGVGCLGLQFAWVTRKYCLL
jgi:hypothetical protein